MTQQPRERPIILHAWEVRGILGGTVTQIWRAMKRQPKGVLDPWNDAIEPGEVWIDRGWPVRCVESRGRNKAAAGELTPVRLECPYGGPGSRLWGRERWRIDWTPACGHGIRYAADEQFVCQNSPDQAGYQWLVTHYGGDNRTEPWRSSATMPRRYSRILLEIEAVSARRVQDVTEADALAVGVGRFIAPYPVPADWPRDEAGKYTAAYGLDYASDRSDFQCSAVEALADNWKRDNPRHPLDSNPYAWRLVVRRVAT